MTNQEFANHLIYGLKQKIGLWNSIRHFHKDLSEFLDSVGRLGKVTLDDLFRLEKRINPSKRKAITAFLAHNGCQITNDGLVVTLHPGVVPKQLFGDWVFMYDLEKRLGTETYLYTFQLRLDYAQSEAGFSGFYTNFRSGGDNETGSLSVDKPLLEPFTIGVSPNLNRGYPDPKFYLKLIQEDGLSFFIGIGVGFNDKERNKLIAARVLGIPAKEAGPILKKREFLAQADFEAFPGSWALIDRILHGKDDGDESGRLTIREERELRDKKEKNPYLQDVKDLFECLRGARKPV